MTEIKPEFKSVRTGPDGSEIELGRRFTVEAAVDLAMLDLFEQVGEGDGENGGAGPLSNCASEIRSVLSAGQAYSYAELSWKTIPV